MLTVLGLGSNLGDSRAIILEAVEELKNVLSQLRRAPLYETAPLHVTNQSRFINTAVAGYYGGSPRELLKRLHSIEESFGRDRLSERRWGERKLDIDILLFGDMQINSLELIIPHAMLKERRFALEPLLELMPGALEPGTGIPYSNICERLPDQGVKMLHG